MRERQFGSNVTRMIVQLGRDGRKRGKKSGSVRNVQSFLELGWAKGLTL